MEFKAADLGEGAVVFRNGRKAVKTNHPSLPWSTRGLGPFANEDVDRWLSEEGAVVSRCCSQWGIGDHDPIEHGGEE